MYQSFKNKFLLLLWNNNFERIFNLIISWLLFFSIINFVVLYIIFLKKNQQIISYNIIVFWSCLLFFCMTLFYLLLRKAFNPNTPTNIRNIKYYKTYMLIYIINSLLNLFWVFSIMCWFFIGISLWKDFFSWFMEINKNYMLIIIQFVWVMIFLWLFVYLINFIVIILNNIIINITLKKIKEWDQTPFLNELSFLKNWNWFLIWWLPIIIFLMMIIGSQFSNFFPNLKSFIIS